MEYNPNKKPPRLEYGSAEWKADRAAHPLDEATLERLRQYQETGKLPAARPAPPLLPSVNSIDWADAMSDYWDAHHEDTKERW